MADHEMGWRIWQLERQAGEIPRLQDEVRRHEQRITSLEATSKDMSKTLFTAANLKEISLLLMIGIMLGTMVAAKDPAGAVGLAAKLMSGK